MDLAQMKIEPNWLSCILLTVGAHFSFNDGVNTQNCRIWSTENSHETIQEDRYDKKNGEAVSATATGERYLQMLRDYAIPQLQNEREGIENMSFMQGGAPPYILRPVKELLTVVFQNQFVNS
ncbi:hypothetical protein ILUMI_09508 [Ignelater luminosus]|uniref:Uncharacterized protein n=1 Tax=Ignelater luminosus TaxID=2038154 RepID=A0A8K0GCC9_IGNLU|nr:hypothetical protein ILUMI_09508 [Ignelater luminosus]